MVGGLEGCEAYIDNVIVYSDSWQQHISQLWALLSLSRFLEATLKIKLNKSKLGHAN